ncbi:cytochrome b561 and DOMON domain-containing protein At3g61750 [Benincasa hispida]|uniref:cytochrome b561 and DOMON domain-containing protein At3g61750 n=1 Tax=Benincasa hispida TaxID=102211 RepID=UPI00190223E8|nr:cytochrome b561 and DOMON domain-containing protein At3g61750 [Benincasa hispida]XP_038878079.1 cytochrome b561 and DOMON domain-containing protein At3g61750 [Benincasa hispida]XP_038878080.1 cytochrome b561 and DOMON domain-containing protein At3g61750 [Benincasa hispida]
MAKWGFLISLPKCVVGFCFLLHVLNLQTPPVVADDEDDDYVAVDSSGYSGYSGGVSEQCDTDLRSFLPPPYGNLTNVVCKPIWNTFVLRYTQNEENVMNIIVSALYTTGWVGIGFSRDGMMVGSSAMVGWVNKKGHARIHQYYLQGRKQSEVIQDKGELPLTNVPSSVVLHGATIYLAFQLKFSVMVSQQPILLAFGNAYPRHNHLTTHSDKTAVVFDFSAGSKSSAAAVGSDIEQTKKNHGVLGIIGWGLILPVGAIIPRYFRHKDPLWYYLHSVIQFVGFAIGLTTVVLGRQLYNKINANVPTHRGIGIFVLVFSILQVLAFFLRPNKEAKIRKYWNWYHHWFGRIALFFGALNIVLGIQIGGAGNEWKVGYGFLLSIILIAVIVLEALAWMKRSDKAAMNSFQMNPVP